LHKGPLFVIIRTMTTLLEEAIAEVLELPEDAQNMAADALHMVIDHVNDDSHYRMTDEQIAGVHHAMGQADRGEFATDAELKEIFGRSL
jgi:hypothetical protein